MSAILGSTAGLKTASLKIGQAEILYGDFLAVTIDFIVIALVVYYGIKMIGIDRLDKKKE